MGEFEVFTYDKVDTRYDEDTGAVKGFTAFTGGQKHYINKTKGSLADTIQKAIQEHDDVSVLLGVDDYNNKHINHAKQVKADTTPTPNPPQENKFQKEFQEKKEVERKAAQDLTSDRMSRASAIKAAAELFAGKDASLDEVLKAAERFHKYQSTGILDEEVDF